MKYWQELEFPGWEIAAAKIRKWINTDRRMLNGKFFWNTTDLAALRVIAPELEAGLATLGVKCTYAALVTAYDHNSNSIHVDNMSFENGVVCRLNVPIQNTVGSYTCFYTSTDPSLKKIAMPNGLTGWLVDPKTCTEVDRVEMLKPTVIRIGVPHAVIINKDAQPRVTLTMRLDQDPERFMT